MHNTIQPLNIFSFLHSGYCGRNRAIPVHNTHYYRSLYERVGGFELKHFLPLLKASACYDVRPHARGGESFLACHHTGSIHQIRNFSNNILFNDIMSTTNVTDLAKKMLWRCHFIGMLNFISCCCCHVVPLGWKDPVQCHRHCSSFVRVSHVLTMLVNPLSLDCFFFDEFSTKLLASPHCVVVTALTHSMFYKGHCETWTMDVP